MRVRTPGDLGNVVRARRQSLRLTQAELATRAGVGRSWLVAVESGHARAELGKTLDVLAELGLELELLDDEDQTAVPGVDLDALSAQHQDGTT